MDSIRASYSQVLLVDNGGFFPEDDAHFDASWFLMDGMKLLGTSAVGVSEKELRWGISYLKAQVKRTGLPVVSANLLDAKTKRPVFPPSVIVKTGGVKVGLFSLMSEKVDLGLARDSLKVEEPSAVAARTIADLRKKGANVVVLLSQLGKVESEDMAAATPGIDLVICGHNVPLIQKGRMVKNTVASYGGEQGQYLSRTLLTLDAQKKMVSGDNESFMLGPEVGEKPEIAKLVKGFEDGLNEKLRKAEKERAATQQQQTAANADRYLGAELCTRCHAAEAEQWKTTSHAVAWQTLVSEKKENESDCISCHVVGFRQPGGWQAVADTPRLVNVQCESCHGMGTRHEAFGTSMRQVGAAVCVGCHTTGQDPNFNYERSLALVAHSNKSGETIKNKKTKVDTSVMGSHGR